MRVVYIWKQKKKIQMLNYTFVLMNMPLNYIQHDSGQWDWGFCTMFLHNVPDRDLWCSAWNLLKVVPNASITTGATWDFICLFCTISFRHYNFFLQVFSTISALLYEFTIYLKPTVYYLHVSEGRITTPDFTHTHTSNSSLFLDIFCFHSSVSFYHYPASSL